MKMRDVLGCVGSGACVLFASAWIPFMGPLFGLLTPLPFLYYSSKLGIHQGVKLAALSAFTIALIARLLGHPQIILFCLEFSLLGLALSELFRRKFSIGQTIFLGTGFMLFLGFGFLFFLALSKNMGPFEMILNYLQAKFKATIYAYEQMGISQGKVIELEAYATALVDIISKVYPSLMVVGTGFAVWLNVVIAKPLFRMGNLTYPPFMPMDRWQAPDSMVWGVIVTGFALFLTSGSIKSVAINALIVMMFVYLFHGLSIVLFFLNKYHVPSWMRVGVYFLIIIQQLFLILVALAGLFDQWIDFRRIHRRTQS
ncbi:MAG: YybS family protein [Methanomassiliicoccales archaeon]|nr:MAG: YybS family protein [Methanomassiliicoccales archaeon]